MREWKPWPPIPCWSVFVAPWSSYKARGEAREDSDYDIAVFIRDAGGFAEESMRLAGISTHILFDTGEVISATPFPAGAYRERTGFMHELRWDGLDL